MDCMDISIAEHDDIINFITNKAMSSDLEESTSNFCSFMKNDRCSEKINRSLLYSFSKIFFMYENEEINKEKLDLYIRNLLSMSVAIKSIPVAYFLSELVFNEIICNSKKKFAEGDILDDFLSAIADIMPQVSTFSVWLQVAKKRPQLSMMVSKILVSYRQPNLSDVLSVVLPNLKKDEIVQLTKEIMCTYDPVSLKSAFKKMSKDILSKIKKCIEDQDKNYLKKLE